MLALLRVGFNIWVDDGLNAKRIDDFNNSQGDFFFILNQKGAQRHLSFNINKLVIVGIIVRRSEDLIFIGLYGVAY
jgi:hypothetical protein